MAKQLTFSTFISIILIISGCSKGGSGGGDPTPPTSNSCTNLSFKYVADVLPIINATCAINSTCHDAGSTNKGGPLTDYNRIFAMRTAIHSQVSSGLMPQTGSLTADQKNKIICWINSGAPNN